MALLGVEVILNHIFNQMRIMVVEQLAVLSDGSSMDRLYTLRTSPGNTGKCILKCKFAERAFQKCIWFEPFANVIVYKK